MKLIFCVFGFKNSKMYFTVLFASLFEIEHFCISKNQAKQVIFQKIIFVWATNAPRTQSRFVRGFVIVNPPEYFKFWRGIAHCFFKPRENNKFLEDFQLQGLIQTSVGYAMTTPYVECKDNTLTPELKIPLLFKLLQYKMRSFEFFQHEPGATLPGKVLLRANTTLKCRTKRTQLQFRKCRHISDLLLSIPTNPSRQNLTLTKSFLILGLR